MTGPVRNLLLKFFEEGQHRQIHKWMHYFEIYNRHFAKFRGRKLALVEFGVSQGGSLQMWKHYFGPKAEIFGVDLDPRCATLEEPGIRILIADQDRRDQLEELKRILPPMDIIIDDGGHRMDQQINTFEVMYAHLKNGGIYLAEDLHTSYWPEFGGDYRDPGSFMEYAKRLIDKLNAWHIRGDREPPDAFTKSTFAMHFYDSVLVIEKREQTAPSARMVGEPSF